MLDDTAKYSGVMEGSRYDLGNYDQCVNIDYDYEHGKLMGKCCPNALLLPDWETGYSNWSVSCFVILQQFSIRHWRISKSIIPPV